VEYPDAVYFCGIYGRRRQRQTVSQMFVVLRAEPLFEPPRPQIFDAPTERIPFLREQSR